MQRKGYVAHFPPAPTNTGGLMDDEWSRAAIDSSISLTSPNNLFSRGEVPKNANNNPFKYSTWSDTVQYTGEIRYFIKIEDSDWIVLPTENPLLSIFKLYSLVEILFWPCIKKITI